jgi:hypothetical protein
LYIHGKERERVNYLEIAGVVFKKSNLSPDPSDTSLQELGQDLNMNKNQYFYLIWSFLTSYDLNFNHMYVDTVTDIYTSHTENE